MLAEAVVHDTTVQVSAISAVGLIVVAVIGYFTAKVTTNAKRDAQDNAVSASKSADIARDFAGALGAKDAFIEALSTRVKDLENRDKECRLKVQELEARVEEGEEQRRSASLIEREQREEIARLGSELIRLQTIQG